MLRKRKPSLWPTIVTGKGTISYTYDATGNKLQKTTVDNTVSPTKTTTTSYIAGAVYENDELQFLHQEEGRIRRSTTSGNFVFDYYLKDHLGNVRMTLTDDNTTLTRIVDATGYYPFGLVTKGISMKSGGVLENKFKYNDGSELNSDLGLDLYETPFRGYDPQTGRFHQMDPLADEFYDWTPYNYTANNPINYNDPTGLELEGEDQKKKDASGVVVPEFQGAAQRTDASDASGHTLATVTVTAQANHGYSFWAQNVSWGSDGNMHVTDNPGYSQSTRDFLQSFTNWRNKTHEFDNATESVVKEGIMSSIPWGRALKGVGWLYKMAKARQAAKVLAMSNVAVSTSNAYSRFGFQVLNHIDDANGVSGLYIFDDATRGLLPYVGKSNVSIASRLTVHSNAGRIGGQIYYKPLTGSTTFLEVQETIMINNLGGKLGTANRVFPVSEARNLRLNLGITNY